MKAHLVPCGVCGRPSDLVDLHPFNLFNGCRVCRPDDAPRSLMPLIGVAVALMCVALVFI